MRTRSGLDGGGHGRVDHGAGAGEGAPVDEFETAVVMLDDRGAGIHPVAAIGIDQAVHLLERGPVDVAADHAVQAALAHVVHDRVLEIEDELQRAFDTALGVARQRPVARNAEQAAQLRQPAVDAHQVVVGHVAQHRHPAVVARDLVEVVAVDEQEATSVRGFVHMLVNDVDIAEGGLAVVAQCLVVVAGDEHDPLAMAGPSQHLLHHRVLRGVPVDGTAHAPEIDDVAHQVKMLRGVLT
jgi:hypothetical protein